MTSLDVFRGITIGAMILVNNPGDWNAVFPPLMHAYWTNWTLADLVFPWFIFIMGFAMPFAFARRHEQGQCIRELDRRIAQRAALLIVLGLILNGAATWPSVAPLRYPGVLQRIALSYLIGALVVLHLDVSEWVLAVALLLLGHWAVLTLLPFGGYPAGTLTPEHNVSGYLDALVFGGHALARPVDPEGLLGTLSSAATAVIGALAGQQVRCASTDDARLRRLATMGVGALAVGVLWSRVLPLSKPLWTGSYVLVVTGLAALAFSVTYVVVDVLQWRSSARPFLWLGVNPLAIYCLSEVVGHVLENSTIHLGGGRTTLKAWLFWIALEPAFGPWPPEWASFTFAVVFVGIWIAVAGLLYRRRIRIQV
jgi:predicted acyltransferase